MLDKLVDKIISQLVHDSQYFNSDYFIDKPNVFEFMLVSNNCTPNESPQALVYNQNEKQFQRTVALSPYLLGYTNVQTFSQALRCSTSIYREYGLAIGLLFVDESLVLPQKGLKSAIAKIVFETPIHKIPFLPLEKIYEWTE